MSQLIFNNELYHYGVIGMKWGVRRYQNPDGSLTKLGKERYYSDQEVQTIRKDYKRNQGGTNPHIQDAKTYVQSQFSVASKKVEKYTEALFDENDNFFTPNKKAIEQYIKDSKFGNILDKDHVWEIAYDTRWDAMPEKLHKLHLEAEKETNTLYKNLDIIVDSIAQQYKNETYQDRFSKLTYGQKITKDLLSGVDSWSNWSVRNFYREDEDDYISETQKYEQYERDVEKLLRSMGYTIT